MKAVRTGLFAVALAVVFAAPSLAGASRTYQVTGPVLEVTADTVVVQKGDERWEIARDKSTNIVGELKVGAKVTIEYRMSATRVEVKEDASKKK
jgi:hypothetical protein